jgi:glutathione peroxidase
MSIKHLLLGLVMVVGCGMGNSPEGTTGAAATGSIYDYTVTDINGKEVPLSQFKDKVVLIVNVASKCGYTPQYKSLEETYKKYKDKGFVILGFPSNNFMGQEPGTNSEIAEFCSRNYGVSFPMFSKIDVKGKDKAPLYKFLTEKKMNGVVDADVSWNFQKFLINKQGQIVTYFKPGTEVTEAEVVKAIEGLL